MQSEPHPQRAAQSSPAEPQATLPSELDWFTTDVWPDGSQTVHLRPRNKDDGRRAILLSHPESQLLMTTLTQIAQDGDIPWSRARQAVLRAFWIVLSDR